MRLDDIECLVRAATASIAESKNLESLETVRLLYLSEIGSFPCMTRNLSSVPIDARSTMKQAIDTAYVRVSELLNERRIEIVRASMIGADTDLLAIYDHKLDLDAVLKGLPKTDVATAIPPVVTMDDFVLKWERILLGIDMDNGIDNCPLCIKFFDEDVYDDDYEMCCNGCPVATRTGDVLCEGTPYSGTYREELLTSDEGRLYAFKELRYLYQTWKMYKRGQL